MKQFLSLLILAAIIASVSSYLSYQYLNHANTDTSLETSEDSYINPLLRTAQAGIAIQRPDFSLPDLQGKQRKNSEWDGKIVILNFWATWCPPCIKEIPMFMHLQRTYAKQGLQVVGIAIDENEAVTEFSTSLKMNYPILLGEEAGIDLSRNLGNRVGALPFTVFIDPQGNIITRHVGELDEEQILKILRPFLKTVESGFSEFPELKGKEIKSII